MVIRINSYLYCIAIIILLFSCHHTVLSQKIPFKNFSREDGLAHSSVYDIFEDSQGFLWFATGYGISRFDGVEFTNYGAEEGLTENFVITIAPASTSKKKNQLWLGTWTGGLQFFDDGTIIPYTPRTGTIPPKIKFLQPTQGGGLFIANNYEAGVLLNGNYTPLDLQSPSGASYQINCVYKSKNGDVLVGSTFGIYKIKGTSLIPYAPHLPQIPVFSITSDTSNQLWAGSIGKVYKITPDTTLTETAIKGLPFDGEIRTLTVDSRGKLWGAIHNKGIFVHSVPFGDLSQSLEITSTHITDIYEDREGGMWLSSYGIGVFYLHNLSIVNFSGKDGLPNNYITSLCRMPSGQLIIGTRNGLGMLHNGIIRSLSISKKKKSIEYISDITRDSSGNYWVIANEIVYKTDSLLETFTAQSSRPGQYHKLYIDRSGKLWVGGLHGVVSLTEGRFSVWDLIPEVTKRRVLDIAEDSEHRMWFATDSGAYCYENGKSIHFTSSNGLPDNWVNAISVNSSGTWLATDNGLAVYKNRAWRIYTTTDGLRENTLIALSTDNQGRLWIGTNRSGIDVFDGKRFTHTDARNGLISNEVQVLLSTQTGIWAGTGRGLTYMQFATGQHTHTDIPVHITSLGYNNRAYTPVHIPQSIPYTYNTVRIDFVGLHYSNPYEVIYEYKIPEISDQWIQTPLRSVNYSSLQPGTYTFLVTARNRGALHPGTPTSITFTIETPFWMSWWFRLMIYSGVITGAYLIIRYRFRYEKNKQMSEIRLSLRMVQLEQQALQALMNPHFIFNVLNSIQHYLNNNNNNDAADYLAKFARLIRCIVDDAGEQYLPLCEELEKLELYLSLEKLRFGDKLDYTISISPAIDKYSVLIPTMILQPYVENAVWHGIMPLGTGGKVNISVEPYMKKSLCITIEDDGIGMPDDSIPQVEGPVKKTLSKEHRSSGMKITKERLHLLAEANDQYTEVTIQSADPHNLNRPGTKVSIFLPLELD